MKKQEVFDYIDITAVRCNALNYEHCGAKKRIAGLKIGESVLLVFDRNHVDACASVHYCGDPKRFDAKEIIKITKESRGVYNMEVTPADQIQSGKTYR